MTADISNKNLKQTESKSKTKAFNEGYVKGLKINKMESKILKPWASRGNNGWKQQRNFHFKENERNELKLLKVYSIKNIPKTFEREN